TTLENELASLKKQSNSKNEQYVLLQKSCEEKQTEYNNLKTSIANLEEEDLKFQQLYNALCKLVSSSKHTPKKVTKLPNNSVNSLNQPNHQEPTKATAKTQQNIVEKGQPVGKIVEEKAQKVTNEAIARETITIEKPAEKTETPGKRPSNESQREKDERGDPQEPAVDKKVKET
ncbi:MAG: hypothetical protein ACQUHE_17565, partial [Bacteroidia bacterium]